MSIGSRKKPVLIVPMPMRKASQCSPESKRWVGSPAENEEKLGMTGRSLIEFKCPHCQADLEAPAEQIGVRMLCPECKATVTVPASQLEQQVDLLMDQKDAQQANLAPPEFEFDFANLAPNEIENLLTQQSAELAPNTSEIPDSGHGSKSSVVPPVPAAPLPAPGFSVRDVADELDEMLKIDMAESTTAKDSLAPIRLDDLDLEVDVANTSAVTCRICDTRIIFPNSKIGTKLKCPECYTMVDAIPRRKKSDSHSQLTPTSDPLEVVATESGELRLADPDHVRKYRDGEQDLTGLSSHREFDAVSDELPDDLGLELAPLEPLLDPGFELVSPQSVPVENPEKGISQSELSPDLVEDEEELRLEAESPKVKVPVQQFFEPEIPTKPDRLPAVANGSDTGDDADQIALEPETPRAILNVPLETPSSENGGQIGEKVESVTEANPPSEPHNPYAPPKVEKVDPEQVERERNPLGMSMGSLSFSDGKFFQWATGLFGDWQLSLRMLLISIGLTLAYWLLGLAQAFAADDSASAASRSLFSVLSGLPGLALFILGWGTLFTVGGLMFEAGGNRRPRWDDWNRLTFGDYLARLVQMGFAFWVASLPGLFVGVALYLMTQSVLGLGLVAAFSGYMLAPLLYFGGQSNGSPYLVIPRKLGRLFSQPKYNWARYIPVSLTTWFLFFVGSLFLIPGGILWCGIGSVFHVVSFVMFSSLIGLFCSLLSDTVQADEERAALEERLKQGQKSE
jgi:hypothetical protein